MWKKENLKTAKLAKLMGPYESESAIISEVNQSGHLKNYRGQIFN